MSSKKELKAKLNESLETFWIKNYSNWKEEIKFESTIVFGDYERDHKIYIKTGKCSQGQSSENRNPCLGVTKLAKTAFGKWRKNGKTMD